MTIRTRIAPSPTGDPHVGTAYMALFNWAFAKQHDGTFVLRIEDTDRVRSTRSSEAGIFNALRWLGLEWSEGPDVGGEYGPYRQSERKALYGEHIQRLLDAGHAFHCFCSKARLDEVRAAQQAAKETTRYDGHCLSLDAAEVKQRIDAGAEHVIRMKVPESGDCVFTDLLRGEVRIPYGQVDMQVLIKADGMPTYHFAVVVDDHLMQISHIIRGEEWLSSVPKHQLLFEYFGWDMPVLVHLPLLRNADQSKLSKRKNPTSINYYRDEGFLPEALLNYLALMGYSMPDEREIFSLTELVDDFDINRVSVRGPIFDPTKLAWLNGQYLRKLSAQEYARRVQEWMLNRSRLEPLIELVQPRAEKLNEIVPLVDYLLGARAPLTEADFEHNKLKRDDTVRVLHHLENAFNEMREWERDALFAACQHLAQACDLKIRDFLFPLFVAISGRGVAVDLMDAMAWLGPDLCRARIRDALEVLKLSGKERKRLDKALTSIGVGDN